jgi:ABC-type lipoprotein release transport system permease subunit
MYPVKHVFRNWKLFTALLIGVILAATFFAGLIVKANVAAEQSLDNQISSIMTDIDCQVSLNMTNFPLVYRNITSIEGVTKVDYLSTFYQTTRLESENYTNTYGYPYVSFPKSSSINDEWTDRPADGIPANSTYIVAGSELANRLKIGDNITTQFMFQAPKYYNSSIVYANLTVAGYATLTDKGMAMLEGSSYYSPGSYGNYRSDKMLIDWDNTLLPIWNASLESSTVNFRFAINVDRDALISPWNTQASAAKITLIGDDIENQILGYISYASMNNALSNALRYSGSNLSGFLVSFFFVSLPIFFVAWYIGSTVSDVSFNIRRREIGLLSTKGLSSGQIQRMFLGEALIVGVVGGFLGVVGGLIVNQYYAGAVNLNMLFSSQLYNPEIMVVTIIFAVVLSLLSVFFSSRRASKIPAVEALRNDNSAEYKTHRKIIPIIAVILGGYKIVVYAFGLNIPQLINQELYTGGNLFLSALYTPVYYFDLAMTFIGPFLFFWGITKLLIRDSTKFQTAISKISAVMGDLGALAAKNVRRNPARLAAIAFVIALIMGLAVQVTGQIATQEDYVQRTVRAQVGADLNINVGNASQGQIVLDQLTANISGIQNATVERILQPKVGDNYGIVTLKAIDPDTWATSAYYEDGWFSGNSISEILKAFKADNNTAVISRSLAKQYDKHLYDTITVNFNSCPRTLKIVGFFGPEATDNSGGGPQSITVVSTGSGSYTVTNQGYTSSSGYNSAYDCYAPRDLFNVTRADGDIYKLETVTTNILIKLQPGVNGTEVAQQVRSGDYNVSTVQAFDEEWQESGAYKNSLTYNSLQTLDIQSFGLVFAVISASVGTALIAIVSLKERSREATLLSVRGLSYRQLVWMFLVESLAIITFAVILGAVVGVIMDYGTVASSNASVYSWNLALVTPRLVFPANAVATISLYAALIYAATIGSIVVISYQYVTKLEKMVRTR